MEKKIKITEIPAPEKISKGVQITMRKCGNVVETIYLSKRNTRARILKLDKHHYINLATGEIKEFVLSAESRADNLQAVKKSSADLETT
jgi:hypothetical protein